MKRTLTQRIRTFAVNALQGRPAMTEEGKQHVWGSMAHSVVWDDVMETKGADAYRKMRHDPDVKAALDVKIGGILTKGWELAPAISEGEDGYEAAKAQSDFVQAVFDEMPGSIDGRLKAILKDALGLGTAVAERLWGIGEGKDTAGKFVYRDLKPKDPTLYQVEVDDFNNVTKLVLAGVGVQAEVDPDKFAFMYWQQEYGQPWGVADLRAAYKFWFIKTNLWKYWAIFLEKYGSPTAVGKYPRGLPKEQQAELLTVIDKIQQETAIVVPDDETVELLEAMKDGKSSFLEAIQECGAQIAKAIVGQTLTANEGTRVGSMALGKVHQDTLTIYIKELKRITEEWMDEVVIRPLIDMNFADRQYPNFTLLYDDSDKQALSEMIYRQVDIGVIKADEPWIRETLGFPAYDPDESTGVIEEPPAMTPGANPFPPANPANPAMPMNPNPTPGGVVNEPG